MESGFRFGQSGSRICDLTSVGFPERETYIWIEANSVFGGRPMAVTSSSTSLHNIQHLLPLVFSCGGT